MRALPFLFFAAVMVVATASPASLEMKDGLAESSTFEPPRQRETLISRPDIAKAKAKGKSKGGAGFSVARKAFQNACQSAG